MRSIKLLFFLTISYFLGSCKPSVNDNPEIADTDSLSTETSVDQDTIIHADLVTKDDSVHVELRLEELSNSEFNFQIEMDLFGDSWIVSPLDYDYPYGSLQIEYDKNEHIELVQQIVQSPESKFIDDPNADELYKVISGKTTLEQRIRIVSEEDFIVHGNVFFVLEPICNPYQIDFEFIQESGNLSIERTNMRIAK